MQELSQADQPRTGLSRLLLGQVRIAGDDAHLESGGASSDRLADLAQADDAEGLAAQLPAGVPAAIPLPLAHRRVGAGHVAEQGQHQCHGVLRGGNGVASRCVDDHHPGAGGRIDLDPIDPHARDADDAQPRGCGGEQLGVDAGLRADDERVPATSLRKEAEHLVATEPEPDIGVVRCGEEVDPGLCDRFDHEDACHGYRRVYRPNRIGRC